LKNSSFYANWLKNIVIANNKRVGDLNYIFCSDNHLLKINQDHLNHDYYTDIITFNNSETENLVEADVYVSVDRVKENSSHHLVTFENELSRIMVHGLLHLFGYNDNTDEEQKVMREKEEACISLQKNNSST